MKDELIQRVNLVIGALNNVTVSGKNNLANLSGSISILEEVVSMLGGVEIAEPKCDDVAP